MVPYRHVHAWWDMPVPWNMGPATSFRRGHTGLQWSAGFDVGDPRSGPAGDLATDRGIPDYVPYGHINPAHYL